MGFESILADNPFTALHHEGESLAIVLAGAFAVSHNADQVFACLRFERLIVGSDDSLASFLDGCHFEAWTMPCGSSKLYSNDADGEAQNAFVTLQAFAKAFLETE